MTILRYFDKNIHFSKRIYQIYLILWYYLQTIFSKDIMILSHYLYMIFCEDIVIFCEKCLLKDKDISDISDIMILSSDDIFQGYYDIITLSLHDILWRYCDIVWWDLPHRDTWSSSKKVFTKNIKISPHNIVLRYCDNIIISL